MSVATYLGAALALASIVISAVSALGDHHSGLAAAWIVAAILLPIIALQVVTMPSPAPPEDTHHFSPFGPLKKMQRWRRTGELAAIMGRLNANRSGTPQVCLVIGASGVGKSVLLRDALPERTSRPVIYVSSYGALQQHLAEASATRGAILVLDQFEQYLVQVKQLPLQRRSYAQLGLANLIFRLIDERNVDVVISVRNEWYCELRHFDSLLPSLADSIEIKAPVSSSRGPIHSQIVSQFKSALNIKDERSIVELVDVFNRDGYLFPLEVQIVGVMLERAAENGYVADSQYLSNSLGGIAGAIDQFFEEIVCGAPYRRVALKILCALSARTRFRQQEAKPDLLEAMFERRDRVVATLEYLVEHHLVVEVDKREELAHDYLAEVFHRKSASELDPTERDNVEFHIEEHPMTGAGHPAVTAVRSLQDREKAEDRTGLVAWILISVAALMTLRLLYLRVDWYALSDGLRAHLLIDHEVLDETYLPIYVAQLVCAIYVGLFYHRIFRHLHESRPARALSMATILVIPPCAVVAMLFPATWILSIAFCGSVLGLKMMFLGRSPKVNVDARARLRGTGDIAMSNVALASLIGALVLGMSVALVHGNRETEYWTLVMIVWSTILTAACLLLLRQHVGGRAAALTLGLLARPLHTVPHPES